MSMKELMGTLSPVYGMATGKGMFGNAVGVVPAIAKDMRDEEEKKRIEKEEIEKEERLRIEAEKREEAERLKIEAEQNRVREEQKRRQQVRGHPLKTSRKITVLLWLSYIASQK